MCNTPGQTSFLRIQQAFYTESRRVVQAGTRQQLEAELSCLRREAAPITKRIAELEAQLHALSPRTP